MEVGNFFILWQDNYSVGHNILDNQHKYLLKIINDLYESMISKDLEGDYGELLKELTKYTKVHFVYEERFLEKIGFQEINDHLAYHAEMKKKIGLLEVDMTTLGKEWRLELLIFLKKWWLDHILKQDMKYCTLVKNLSDSEG